MTHEEIKILISAYIDGEVNPSEKNIVEEHLKTCTACQKDYNMYKAISSSLSKWPNETLSPDEAINVQKRFEQRRGPMFTQRTMMTLGTTLALAIIVGSVVQQYVHKGDERTSLPRSVPLISPTVTNHLNGAPAASFSSTNMNLLKSSVDELKNPIMAGQTVDIIKSVPMMRREPIMGNMALATATTSYSIENNRLGTDLVGSDASSMRMRTGAQVAGYYPYQYNPYPQPNYYWYYPQPYPVEPYRYQSAESNTEQYDRIYDNPFLSAKENPLSTFSIDVDTGSYSNIRRFLRNEQKPPKDAVHIEELINYFSYDYPQPTGEDPFSITTEVSSCPWNPKHQLALIGLQGKKIPMENFPASNLIFLIDVSGSMGEEDKLPLVKASLHLLVEQLRPQDTVSIAVFAGGAERLLEATSGRDKDKILDAIDSLEAGGSTNGEEGLQLAYKMAKENFIPNGNNRIIVTTDGDFNVGTSDDGDLVRMIEEKRDEGVYLTVFGFGMGNLKADRMEKLADAGHGNYDYIDSLDEARKELEQQLGGTLYAIAKDVKIQVEFNPATVKAYRLIGYEKRLLNKEDFNNDRKDAGVLGSGHTVTALYEITPANSNEDVASVDELRYQTSTVNPSSDLMTIKLRYKDPQSDTSKLIIKTLNSAQITETPSENLRFAGAVAEFGMLLRDSEYKGNSSYLQVMDAAQKAIGTDYNGYRKDFLDLIEKAGLLGHASSADDSHQDLSTPIDSNNNEITNPVINAGTGESINRNYGLTDHLTFSAWVYFYSLRGWETMIGQDTSSWFGGNAAFYLQKATDTYASCGRAGNHFDIYLAKSASSCDPGDWAGSQTMAAPNTWYMVTGTYDGSMIKLYVNGILEGVSARFGSIGQQMGNISIGSGFYRNNQADILNGITDDVRIYNRALSANEIARLYQRQLKHHIRQY